MVMPFARLDRLRWTLVFKSFINGASIDGGARLFLRSNFTSASLSEHRLGPTKTYAESGLDILCGNIEVEPIIVAHCSAISRSRLAHSSRASRFSRSY